MYRKLSIFLVIFMLGVNIKAQEFNQTQKTGFIIISASKNYNASKKIAEQASKKLSYKLNLRGLQPNKEMGLSFSKEECEDLYFEFPAVVERGRGVENKFVSVEYTDHYKGFSKGFYIVVVAHFPKNSPELKTSLKHVKKFYKQAYIKYADIYMGCIY